MAVRVLEHLELLVLRVAIYLRISKDDRGARVGVEAQRGMAEVEVGRQKRLGVLMEVVGIYCDNDRSAFAEQQQRPEYDRLVADCRARRIDVVMARSVDRLDRREDRLKDIAEELWHAGVDIWTVKDGRWDLSTADGRNAFALAARLAQMEAEKTSERVRDAIDRQLELAEEEPNAWVMHQPRAYGFVDDGEGGRAIEPAEAAVIREAADRLLAGEALRQVVLELNARGVPTSTGREWKPVTLRQVLESPRITGLRRHRRSRHRWQRGPVQEEWVQETTWPRILERETWEAVQAVLAQRKRGSRAVRSYCLSGLLECGRCGRPLFSRPNRGIRTYRCSRDLAQGRDGCGHNVINAEAVEAVIARNLIDRVSRGTNIRSAARRDQEAGEVARQLAEVRIRLDRLGEQWLIGDVAEETWQAAQRKGREVLAALQTRQAELLSRSPLDPYLGGGAANLAASWDGWDMDRRHRFIEAALRPKARIPIAPHDGDAAIIRKGRPRGEAPSVEERVLTIPWLA